MFYRTVVSLASIPGNLYKLGALLWTLLFILLVFVTSSAYFNIVILHYLALMLLLL